MKKIIYISLFIHLIIIVIFAIIIYFLVPNSKTNIENNIVKIEKEAEIISTFQDKIENNLNPSKTILSWFFIDENTIITANHWVNSSNSNYKITDKFWNIYTWTLLEKDEQNDLAYLKIENSFKNFVKFKYAKNTEIWDEVYSLWFDLEKKSWKVLKLEWNKIFSSIIFENWDSGGGLFNERDEFVGVNVEVSLSLGISTNISAFR